MGRYGGGADGAKEEEGGDEEKGEEKVEDLRLPCLEQSGRHKFLQSISIPLVQLVLDIHLLTILLTLLTILVVTFVLLLIEDDIKHDLHSLVVAEAKIISRNPENDVESSCCKFKPI